MKFRIQQTEEAIADVSHMAAYMIETLHNQNAANDFIANYQRQIELLQTFPLGCRGIQYHYHGYQIMQKSFGTYSIFYIVDNSEHLITILRVLKHTQNLKQFFFESITNIHQ